MIVKARAAIPAGSAKFQVQICSRGRSFLPAVECHLNYASQNDGAFDFPAAAGPCAVGDVLRPRNYNADVNRGNGLPSRDSPSWFNLIAAFKSFPFR